MTALDTKRPKILLVEDDPDLSTTITDYLSEEGLEVERAADGATARRRLARGGFDLVVVDLGLPDESGLDLTRHVRSTTQAGIVILTGRGDPVDRVVGLELGADDYLAKPFSPNERVARVRALLRRAGRGTAPAAKTLAYGPIALDTERHLVSTDGRDVALTAKEFLLLEYLLLHRGRVLSRDVLLTDVWGYRYTGGTRTVDVHVRRLRERLPVLVDGLVTVKQFGYKLADPGAPRA